MSSTKLYLNTIFIVLSISGVLSMELLNITTQQNLCHHPLPPVASQIVAADPTLQSVFGVFRHGIRSVLGHSSTWIEDGSRPSKGRLTKEGKQQLYIVGKVLRQRYGGFVSDYDEDQVTITSTSKKRNIMSALSLLAGLFPPREEIFPDLRWQPIPVDTNTADFDKSYLYSKADEKIIFESCPPLHKYILPGWKINKLPDSRPYYKQMYELLQHYSGNSNITSVEDIMIFTDIIHFACLTGEPPADWLLTPRTEYQNKTLYPDLIRPVAHEYIRNVQYFDNNLEMLSYIAGPIINQIQTLFEQVLHKNSLRKMSIHVTHDNIINPLLWYLNPNDTNSINMEPGDGLLFELHEVNNTTSVKVFHYDAMRGHVVSELEMSTCPPPCSYEGFKTGVKGVSPEQWREKCQL